MLPITIGQSTLEFLSSVKQAAHDRPFGHLHGLSHLLVAHAFHLTHDDDGTVIGRQCVESLLDARAGGNGAGTGTGAGATGGDGRGVGAGVGVGAAGG